MPSKAGHHSRKVRSLLRKNLNHNFGGDVNGIAHLDPDFSLYRCRCRCRCCRRCWTQGLFGPTRRQVVKSPEYLATIVPSVTDAKAVYSSRDSRCSKMYSLLDLYRFLSPDRKRTMSVRHFEVDLRKCVKVNVSYMLSKFSMYYSTSEDVHTA